MPALSSERGSQPGVEFEERGKTVADNAVLCSVHDVDEVVDPPSASRERGGQEACRRRHMLSPRSVKRP
jgi:hypothetical protein